MREVWKTHPHHARHRQAQRRMAAVRASLPIVSQSQTTHPGRAIPRKGPGLYPRPTPESTRSLTQSAAQIQGPHRLIDPVPHHGQSRRAKAQHKDPQPPCPPPSPQHFSTTPARKPQTHPYPHPNHPPISPKSAARATWQDGRGDEARGSPGRMEPPDAVRHR
jgi:hypothetical protein